MDLDLWWLLLLPAFFSLGWLAARVDMRTVLKQAKQVPAGFFRGLDALVEDKTDVAAQALAEVVRQQQSSLELQLTLGKLYRKRGENDRAIRLHQQMLESSDLPSEHRDAMRYELAQDFRKAGLVDRAEEILLKLLDGNMGCWRASNCWIFTSKTETGARRSPPHKNCATTPIRFSTKWHSSIVNWRKASYTNLIMLMPEAWCMKR